MVVMVGVDVHKHTHCAVAVDEAGRQLGRPITVQATDAGHRQLLVWAARSFPDPADRRVVFAVEDCRHGCPKVLAPPHGKSHQRY
jgi:hypothetical protein